MYKYYLTARPRSIGTQPEGYKDWEDYDDRKYIPEIEHRAWGWILYEKRLTQDEVKRYELIDANGPEILTDPTGDWTVDNARELEGADYAVQFFASGKFGTVDLHSEARTDAGALWSEGAYGNMQIYAMNGSADEIYLMTERGLGKAYRDARLSVREKKDSVEALREKVAALAIRIINRAYLEDKREARKRRYEHIKG